MVFLGIWDLNIATTRSVNHISKWFQAVVTDVQLSLILEQINLRYFRAVVL